MNFQPEVRQSKFQEYHETVMEFLNAERRKDEKLIYKHQTDALFAVHAYFDAPEEARAHPALVVAPTGAGKTGIVTLLPYVLAAPKVLILSPSLTITDDLEKAFGLKDDIVTNSFVFERKLVSEVNLNSFLEDGTRIVVTAATLNMQRHNLVIVNAQKFGSQSAARLAGFENDDDDMRQQLEVVRTAFASFSTLIVDEAHHYPATTWDLIVERFVGKQIIFLTATPFRGYDRLPLRQGQQITYSISKSTLIELKIIRNCEFKIINCVPGNYECIGVQIMSMLRQHDLLEPNVQHKAMVLVSNTTEAANGASGCLGRIATYYTSDKRTERNKKNFDKSQYRILFVCGMLLEGYNNSDVSVCVILRNVGVLGLFTQFVGRCVRVSRNVLRINDSVTATVASLIEYDQQDLFDLYTNED